MYGLNVSSKPFDGVNRYVRITDINDDTHDLVSNDICSPSSFTKNYLLSEGDLLFARTGASVGKTYLYHSIHGLQYFAGYLIKFHFKDDLIAKYVFYSTQTTRYKNWVNVFSKRSGQPGINSGEYSKFEIYLPKSNELKKIVIFFELLERKIKIVDAKYGALKKYKEGIVQKLLNSLANSNLISLDQLCQITTGKLDANAQIDKGKYKFFTCAREDFLIDTYAFDTEAILVSGNGEVGLTKHYKGKFNAYQRTYVLYDFTLNPLYLKACIDSQINNVIRKETNKGAMPYIKLSTFAKIKIPMISKEESNNIGTLMVSLDSKINCYERIMVTISKMKSFLLNNLFI